MCLLVIAPTLLFAQDEDTSAADDYSNTHIAATGTDLFAVPIPGEIYSPFIGKISHRSTDMVIKGNGPLSIAITREHEETPQAYPYALGTMSLNNPRLVITTGVTSSEYNSTAARTLSCNTWDKSIFGGDIQFEHPGGMVRLINRQHLLDTLLASFPSNALFISNNNWYVSCDSSDPSKFMIHSPDGTRFTTGEVEWHPKSIVGYNAAYTLYVETIENAGSRLVYDYENDTNSNAEVLPPLAFTTDGNARGIRNKQRLESITLIDGSSNPRTVNLTYRASGASECPNLLSRIGSNSAPNGEVFYEYTQREIGYYSSYKRTECELTGVLFSDGSRWEFEYRPSYLMSSTRNLRTSNGNPNSEDVLLGTRSLYLPINAVTTPTGAKANYTYINLYECKYKTVFGSNTCNARRPAISTRTIEDSTGSSFPSETHTVTYDNTNATLASSARRTIVNSARKHELYFNIIDRSSNIKSTNTDDLTAKTNSSKIKTHYVYPAGSSVPISGVVYEYSEMRNFLDYGKIATPGGADGRKTWQWAYEAPRNNLDKTTTDFDGSVLQTERRQFNIYNLPDFIDEHNITTGEKRTTWRRYDNNYQNKDRWVIGLVDKEHSGTSAGITLSSADKTEIQRSFDADGQIQTQRVHGFLTSYSHNSYGALSSSTDGRGNATYFSGYNNGVPTRKQLIPGTGTARSWVYSSTGLVYRTLDESGVRVDYRYDNMGRLQNTWSANDLDTQQRTVAPVWHDSGHSRYRNKYEFNYSGWRRYTYYDALGRVTRVLERDTTNGTTDVWHKTVYDKLGRVVQSSYASASNLGSGDWPGVTQTYDSVDRIVSQSHSGSPGQITYCYGVACNSSGFGTNGRVKFGYAVKDQDEFVSVYNFRALGNAQTNEVSEIYQQIDDGNNWVATWIDRNIHGFITQVAQGQYKSNAVVRTFTPYVFESRNTLTMLPGSETHPEFGTRQVTNYDDAGNMTTVENFSGNTLTYTYTNRNQIDAVQSSDGSYSVDRDYLANGFLEKLSTPSTTWKYSYVPGRSLLDSESLTTDGQTLTLSYGYDAIENLSTLTYPNGITATYDYNGLRQPTSLTVDSGSGNNDMASGATYFPNGQLSSLNMSNGMTFSSTQNARTLPDRLMVSKAGGMVPPQDIEYIYDGRLNVKRITNYLYPYNGGMAATYDGMNRLKTVSGSIWGSEGAQYEYDRVGNIERAELAGYTLDYSYSGTSNRLNSVMSTDSLQARSYTGITYDANGNVTSTDGSDVMTYDEMNQMLSSSRSTVLDGVVDVTNLYDGQGYRIKTTLIKDNRTKSTYSLYNQAGDLLYELDAESGEQRSHLFFNGKSIATLGANATADADSDGVPDYYERLHGMDPYHAADATEDADGDTIDNVSEYLLDSLVQSSDSDGDGLPDNWERRYQGRLNDASDSVDDPDGDGVSNYNEYLANTNPAEHLVSDTDYLVPSVHILFP